MSECVVRMEMPKRCDACCLRFVCQNFINFFTTKESGPHSLIVGMEGCLILCELPENHGQLVDKDELFYNMFVMEDGRVLPNYDCDNFHIDMHVKDIKQRIRETPTIVPAERSENHVE